jgi:hypothetical protein
MAEDAGEVALLGYDLWQRRYGGDPQAVGKTIELDKQVFTIDCNPPSSTSTQP